MLERLIGWFQLLWDAGKYLQEHSAAIKESKEDNGRLLALVQMLAVQNQQLSALVTPSKWRYWRQRGHFLICRKPIMWL